MIVADKDQVFCSDVDNTLVMWDGPDIQYHHNQKVAITNPYATGMRTSILVVPNYDHIKLLRTKKARGSWIIVWSYGGVAWAEAVIKGLGLEMYVDLCCSKPETYIDDVDIAEWGMRNLYLHGVQVRAHLKKGDQ